MDMMSETGPCNPPSDCKAGQVTDEGKERVSVLQTDVVSIAQRSGPPEDITGPIDDSAYYVTWTVLIVLAVPRGTSFKRDEPLTLADGLEINTIT